VIHVDKGDLRNGVAALTAQSVGDSSFEGGQLILARYGLAFCIEMGDVLYFDPHLEHCNAPMLTIAVSPPASHESWLKQHLLKKFGVGSCRLKSS
jgi:hypothetical protein